jgi:uncharacterized protein YjbI with pentapeptide repeats
MDMKMLGNRITDARKKLNLSQAELSQHLFISPQAVGKWERGESIPDIITFNRLAKILGVDLNYFSNDFKSLDNEKNSEVTKTPTDEPQKKFDRSLNIPKLAESHLPTDFSACNLPDSDFSGIIAHKMKFNASLLKGSNFAKADLTGSSFTASNMSLANFTETNLTDCVLSTTDLTNANFNQTILIRTVLTKLDLIDTKFTDTKLLDVKLIMVDLRRIIFDNCIFNGVKFKNVDLRGVRLDAQTFVDVEFHNVLLNDATFNGATLKNVSFRSTSLTNKYYRTVSSINFDGAVMDKLTYMAFKGLGADLSKVTTILG